MRHLSFSNIKQRLRNVIVASVFIGAQAGFALVPFLPAATVSAAPICVNDTAGANDEPGQKDLTKLCVDYAGLPSTVNTTWGWDELGTSGANTLDACNLFDTDGDGNINYAVCVTTTGKPAVLQSTTTYSCGDDKVDRCTSPATPIANGATVCAVSQQNSDPFPTGDDYPKDTQGTCTVSTAAVGGATAKLIDVCSYPSSQPNSDPSDCVIARENAGKLEVIKNLVPDADSGLFNLQIDAVTKVTNVGDNGTTGEVVVSAGNHSVGELAGTNTSLASYTSSIECKNLNGTGAVVASGATTSLASVPVADGSDIVCIITNTKQQGSITLIKNVVNNNGGSATPDQFGLSIAGNGVTSGQKVTLSPGSYAINEAGLAGYSFVSITGTGCPAQLNGLVNLTNGQDITCTITNDDISPTLTIVKNVTNNNGGTATASNFQGKIDGNNVAWSTVVPLNAGSHSASESAILPGGAGYTASTWSGDCTSNGNVTLTLAQNAVCTITNDDQAPSLTLNKLVSNLHGGTATESAWTLTANGPTSISGQGAAGNSDVISGPTFSAGTYTLSESGGPSGYAASAWTCTNNVTVTNNQITLANGQVTTCSITNSDIAPILTVLKQVLNPYGTALSPSAFPLFVDGTSVTSGVARSQFNAGTHTITEIQQFGYTFTGVSGDCTLDQSGITVLLVIGESKTCTLTNTAIQPKLTVIKHVINDNSGTSSADDFTMTVTGNSQFVPNFPGDENGTEVGLNEGNYSANELADAGYTKSFSGDCSGTIAVGETKTCTITNDDVAHPAINIVKNGPATAHEGDQVVYTFDVTNTGDTATLANVTVNDTIGNQVTNAVYASGDTNNDGLLQKTETWHFTLNYVIPEDTNSVVNTGQACGFDPAQTKVCDTDTHTLDVLHPELQVIKTASTEEANPGDTVTYTFTVTNLGDTPLDITKVHDSIALDGAVLQPGGDTNGNELLDTSETWVYTIDYTIPANQDSNVVNVVTVCGEDALEGEDCDTDTHTLVVLAKVIVTKYNDVNRNGVFDNGDELLPDWEFTLGCNNPEFVERLVQILDNSCQDKTQSTGQDGTTTFTSVKPNNNYTLNETIPADSNWHLGSIVCSGDQAGLDGDTYYINDVTPGGTINCSVGNYRDAVLELTKANDQPNPVNTGTTVTYTLTVTVPEDSGAVFGAEVTDLTPEGFTYIPGSWTAESNMGPIEVAEPQYGSPGIWKLGYLVPGSIVTLTYKALIGTTVSNGTYPDLAFARGCDVDCSNVDATAVFANVSTGASTPFVGTNVSIVRPEVLAANITRYVNTGASDVWINTLAAITLAGAAFITLVRREKKGVK